MKDLIAFNHALSDDKRWRILQLIMSEALCVCEIADIMKMPQSSVSSHVQVIKKADLLDSERREKWIYYRVQSKHRALLNSIANYFGVSPESEPVMRADAKHAEKRLAKREASCCPRPEELASKIPIKKPTKAGKP
ncbi:ArsR/SmtB family transcription factor [Roseimicrobium gellanilyticum]|nr:metalloregulator ArsR/SmtB family transcription factor [Roseimicrobium gellanilyticum]